MRRLLLGVDIGTSSCKVAVFSRNGEVIADTSGEYPVYYPHPGWAEQNPEEWWKAVCQAIKQVLTVGNIAPEEIVGVGVDGQSWSAIAMDADGNVLTNTPIWMDTRAWSICDRLNLEIGKEAIFAVSGNSLQPAYSTGKVLWYKENMPSVYKKIHKILQSNSFIVYRMTGVYSQDKSQGYGLHCFDMKNGTWNMDMCKKLGIPEEFLPDVYECSDIVGRVTEEAAGQTGLAEGTPVVAGALDAACGTLGAGVIHPGETQEQGGQAGGMSICLDRYATEPRLILGCYVIPGHWILQGGTVGGGGVMRWLEQEFAEYERSMADEKKMSSLEQMNVLAKTAPAGSDGMVFLPYMAGERSPIWDPHAKGVFYGLDFRKTKGHFIRAAMEGVAYSVKHNLEAARQAGVTVDKLYAMGGSANSLLWTQIKSDVTEKPVVVSSSDTATTLGAAILAGVGTGLYKSFEEAVEMTVERKREHVPNEENKEVYRKNYEIYLELYEKLKDTMRK